VPPTVTVSIPYYGCLATIRRAVTAVLAQTHTALRLVVVNDGDPLPPWPALADLADPRLIRFDLPANHGRYFCDAIALAACDTPWWTVHDADDEAEPDWLATMLATARRHRADVVFTAQTKHTLDGTSVYAAVKRWDGTAVLRHHAHMAGLWRTDWLRLVGGPHPGYRIGYDTLLTAVAFAAGRVAVVERPLYHRHQRAGSLTQAPATRSGSPERHRARTDLRAIWPTVLGAATDTGPAAAGRIVSRTVRPADRHDVTAEAQRLTDTITRDRS